MLKAKGVAITAYAMDDKGRRFCITPFLHYPDYCPHWTGDKEGDCISRCGSLPDAEIRCYRTAMLIRGVDEKGNLPVQTQEPPIEIPLKMQEVVEERVEESAASNGFADVLDALSGQIESTRDKLNKELENLARSVKLARERV